MGKRIQVDLPNESFFVEIAGDEPTVREQMRIAEIISAKRNQADMSQVQAQAKADYENRQLFDTKSGIQNATLRSALSVAETNEEEEAVLKERYGFGEGDFVRDKRGRLAITQSGGEKLGLNLIKDTLVDEEGFSRYDFADLAGIAPELVGGIGGAIAGIPLGPAGIIGGSVLGAMGGAGAEEAGEALLGVSKQTGSEIAKDIAIEGGITLAGELTFGLAGALFRAGRKGLSVKELPKEELEAAGEALTYQITDPATGQLIDVPITPELAAIGAPNLIARQSKIMERVIGSSDRLKNNYDNMQKILNNFRQRANAVEAATAEEVGEATLDAAFRTNRRLVAEEEAARRAVVQTLSGATDQFMSAALKGADVDETAFKILADSSKAFDSMAADKFVKIENLVGKSIGTKQFINTQPLKELGQRLEREYGASIAAGRGTSEAKRESVSADIDAIISGLKGLGAMAETPAKTGFLQLYNLRKTLNDGKMATGSSTGRKELKTVIAQIDEMLDPKTLDALAVKGGLGEEGTRAITEAASSLKEARGFFQRGQTAIDDLQDAIGIKDLAEAARSGTIPAKLDFLTTLVRNGKPQSLVRSLDVVKKFSGAEQAEQLRGLVATRWLENALEKTIPDGIDAAAFSGKNFAKSIKDLGKTADTLFGDQAGQVRALARQIEKSSSSNMTEEAILQAVKEGGTEGANVAGLLRNVLNAQNNLNSFTTTRALRDLAETGTRRMSPEKAAEYVAAPNVDANRINTVINSFKAEGNTEALDKIRSFYMNNILRDFGGDTFVDGKAIKDFAKNFNDAAKGGKFRAIFGDEMGKDMEKFGRVLSINAKTAQGGDLVAANIAASPLNNLGKIAKYGLFTRFLTSAPYYKQVLNQYNALSGSLTPNKKAELLGNIISQLMTQAPGQLGQEAVNEGSRQLEALMQSSGVSEQLSDIQSRMQPPVSSSGIGQVNVTSPLAQTTQPTGQQPNIRQQAAANPAVAQALGIQGPTAGLLGQS
jgi:hypothetical protein